jgi:flagellar hook-length control protein FliK
MVFNPLFIQKQSFEEGKSVLKPSKLQNSSYIFSDIIKVYSSDDQEAADGQMLNSPLGAAVSGTSSATNGTQAFAPAAGPNVSFINNYTQSLGAPSTQTATAKIGFPATVTTAVSPMTLSEDQASVDSTSPAPGNAMELLGKMDTKPSAMLVNPSLYLGQVNGGEILQNTISGIQAYLLNDGKTAEEYSATAPQTQAPATGQSPVTDNVIKTGSVATVGVDAFTFENFTSTPLPGANTAGQGITAATTQDNIGNLLTAVDKNVNNQVLVSDGTKLNVANDASMPTTQAAQAGRNTSTDEAKPVSEKDSTNIPAATGTPVDVQAAVMQTAIAPPAPDVQPAGQQPIVAKPETAGAATDPTMISDSNTISTPSAPVKSGKPARPAQRVTTAQKPTSVNEATAVKGKAKAGKTVQPAILPVPGNQLTSEGEKNTLPDSGATTTQNNFSATAAMPQPVTGTIAAASTTAVPAQPQAAGQMKQPGNATPLVNADATVLNASVETSKATKTVPVTNNEPVVSQAQDTSTGNTANNVSTTSVKSASQETTATSGTSVSDPNPVQPENSLKDLFGDELKKAGEELLKNASESKNTANQSAAPIPQPEFKAAMSQPVSQPVLSTEQKPELQQATPNANVQPQTETVAQLEKPAFVRNGQVVSEKPATVKAEASSATPKLNVTPAAQPKENSTAKPDSILQEKADTEITVNAEPVTKEQAISSPSPKAQPNETAPMASPKNGKPTVVKNVAENIAAKQDDFEHPETKRQDSTVPFTANGKKATQVTTSETGTGDQVITKAGSGNAPAAFEKENTGVRSEVSAAAPMQPELVKAKHSEVEKNDVVSSAKAGSHPSVSDNSPANDGEKKDSGAKPGQNTHQPVAPKASAQENTESAKPQSEDTSSTHKEDTPHAASSVSANSEPATLMPRETGIGQAAEVKNKAQAANPEPKQSAAETVYKNLKPTEILRELHATILSQDKQRVVYNLEPESLGKMRLLLETTQSSVSAHIEVESEAARQSVEANMQQLRQSLQQDGMQNVAIQISLKNPDQKQQRNGSQKKSTQAVGQPSFENDDEQTAEKRLGYNTYEYLA